MKKKFLWLCVSILLVICIIIYPLVPVHQVQAADGPIIQIDEASHTFPPSFEGVDLSYTFTVSNKGTADLHIKKVTTS